MLDNLPEWTPPILAKLYRGDPSSEIHRSPTPLLVRFVSDPRMEKVWRAIINRNADPEYPMLIYVVISVFLSQQEPKLSPKIMKDKYLRIGNLCRNLISEMDGFITDHETIVVLEGIEEAANSAVYHFTTSPYATKITRFDKTDNPKQTVLIRTIYRLFMEDIKQPLWGTIPDLASVALDLHGDSAITEEKVRSCCAGYNPPPRSKRLDDDCGMPVEIEPIPHGE